MDFLKTIFGDKALTYAELEAALKDNKDIKLANLASGQYVDKAKLDGKISELNTANQTIKDLQDTVKKFDGVDPEKLKKDVSDWEQKYNNDIGKLKLDYALETALMASKAKNIKAVKALLNFDEIKLDGDKLLGLDAQLEAIKKDNDFLFEAEKQGGTQDPSTVTLNSGGAHSAKGGVDYDKMSDEEYYAQVFKKDK
jgi:hypothetical protein